GVPANGLPELATQPAAAEPAPVPSPSPVPSPGPPKALEPHSLGPTVSHPSVPTDAHPAASSHRRPGIPGRAQGAQGGYIAPASTGSVGYGYLEERSTVRARRRTSRTSSSALIRRQSRRP